MATNSDFACEAARASEERAVDDDPAAHADLSRHVDVVAEADAHPEPQLAERREVRLVVDEQRDRERPQALAQLGDDLHVAPREVWRHEEEPVLLVDRSRDRRRNARGNESVAVQRDVDDVGLVGAEHAEGTDVARGLRDDDVAGVDEEARHKVQGLLGTCRDDDVVGVRLDPLETHHLEDLLAQRLVALPRTVLQGRRPAGRDDALSHLPDHVERQPLEVRHAAGE